MSLDLKHGFSHMDAGIRPTKEMLDFLEEKFGTANIAGAKYWFIDEWKPTMNGLARGMIAETGEIHSFGIVSPKLFLNETGMNAILMNAKGENHGM